MGAGADPGDAGDRPKKLLTRLHRFLDGAASEPPEEWVISRVCEEFHCLPSAAIEELEAGPLNLATDIIMLRAYAEAKRAVDGAKSEDDLPNSPLIDQVMEIQAELIKEQRGRSTTERNPQSD